MSYKLKEIIYNADGYYPIYENENDENDKNNIKDYKIKIINTKTDEFIYTPENIKDYLHR